jgi:DNA-binding CsgD family transcriptional regulator
MEETNGMEAAVQASVPARTGSSRPLGEGHGRRLTHALEALEAYPALAESRDRLLRVVGEEQPSTSEMVVAVECDPALAIAVLRLANRCSHPRGGKIVSIRDGVELLGPTAVEALATRTDVFHFFERSRTWDVAPERFRLHAVAVQRAAERIAARSTSPIATACSWRRSSTTSASSSSSRPTPATRTRSTARRAPPRSAFAPSGSSLGSTTRSWAACSRGAGSFPPASPPAIERHHAVDTHPDAAVVRLADMIASYASDQPVDPREMLRASRTVGLSGNALRSILYELPFGISGERRHIDPCPLSARQLEILRRLSEGKVYKQIASEIGLSTSTVRTHLHNTYAKLGAVDRAQAVLLATQRGWL